MEIVVSAVLERCIKLLALTVARKPKFLSSPTVQDLSIVGTVTRSVGQRDIRGRIDNLC
jgi:hypothetical protein